LICFVSLFSRHNSSWHSKRHTSRCYAATYSAGGQARTSYLAAAHKHYVAAGGRWQLSPYISYDSQFVPAASVLIRCTLLRRQLLATQWAACRMVLMVVWHTHPSVAIRVPLLPLLPLTDRRPFCLSC
jgi:hypothetical protein